MVSQQHWEDEVIWNGADIKPEVFIIRINSTCGLVLDSQIIVNFFQVLQVIKSKWSSVGGKEADYKKNFSTLRFGMPNYSGFMSGQRVHSSFPGRPM